MILDVEKLLKKKLIDTLKPQEIFITFHLYIDETPAITIATS